MSDETRVPPQNTAAEQSVIGAVIISNSQFDAVAEIIETADFYRERHRTMWDAMGALAAAKRPIDAITLAAALGPQLEAIGGSKYIFECADVVPAPSMGPHYAQLVHEKAIQRALVTFGNDIARQAFEAPAPWSPDFTDELLACAEYGVSQIVSRQICKPEETKASIFATMLWKIEHHVQSSIPTGFARLDHSFDGFEAGEITILGARTTIGKTALATGVAINAAKLGTQVAYFTLEMSAEQMWRRAIGCAAQIDMFRVKREGFRSGECERFDAAQKLLEQIPLRILYRPAMNPRSLRIECRRLARELGGLKLVVIDYFNLMRGDRRERDRWREMQEVVLALKSIAGELGVPILLLSQLNRDANESTPPVLANLRDTGSIEEHSSNVLLLWQKPLPDGEWPYGQWQEIEIILAKQRNGPAGMRVPLEFMKCWGSFQSK
jgi:replicative DNA helicase